MTIEPSAVVGVATSISSPPSLASHTVHSFQTRSLNTHHQSLRSLQARIADSRISRSVLWIKVQRGPAIHPGSPSEGFVVHSPLAPLGRGEQEGSGVARTDRDPSLVGGRARPGWASLTLAVRPGSRTSYTYSTELRIRGRVARGCTSYEEAAPASFAHGSLPALLSPELQRAGASVSPPQSCLSQYLVSKVQSPRSSGGPGT